MLLPGPARRRQLDAPDWALQVHRPLELHERGRGPGRDPVAQVGRVLAHERRHDPGETAQFYLYEVARGRARDVADEELVFALRAQLGVEKVRFRRERQHVAGGRGAGRQVLQNGDGDPVVEIFRQLDLAVVRLVVDLGPVPAGVAIEG